MHIAGVGNIPELGLGENGPGVGFITYKKVDDKVGDYVDSVRKDVFDEFYAGLDSTSAPAPETPRDLYEVQGKIKTLIDRNGPILAEAVLVQEYSRDAAVEGPAPLSCIPVDIKRFC